MAVIIECCPGSLVVLYYYFVDEEKGKLRDIGGKGTSMQITSGSAK
jgi:hypothetical protein